MQLHKSRRRCEQPHSQPTVAGLAMARVLTEARTAAGLSQTQLGDAIGVHRNTVWRFESGEVMSLDAFFLFCDAVGVPAGQMVMRIVKAIEEPVK